MGEGAGKEEEGKEEEPTGTSAQRLRPPTSGKTGSMGYRVY